jgi:hypothetical protein
VTADCVLTECVARRLTTHTSEHNTTAPTSTTADARQQLYTQHASYALTAFAHQLQRTVSHPPRVHQQTVFPVSPRDTHSLLLEQLPPSLVYECQLRGDESSEFRRHASFSAVTSLLLSSTLVVVANASNGACSVSHSTVTATQHQHQR